MIGENGVDPACRETPHLWIGVSEVRMDPETSGVRTLYEIGCCEVCRWLDGAAPGVHCALHEMLVPRPWQKTALNLWMLYRCSGHEFIRSGYKGALQTRARAQLDFQRLEDDEMA